MGEDNMTEHNPGQGGTPDQPENTEPQTDAIISNQPRHGGAPEGNFFSERSVNTGVNLTPATAGGPSLEGSHPVARLRSAINSANQEGIDSTLMAVRGTGGAQGTDRGGETGTRAEGKRPPGGGLIGRREFLMATGAVVGGVAIAGAELQTGFIRRAVNFLRGKDKKAVVPPKTQVPDEPSETPTPDQTVTPKATAIPEKTPDPNKIFMPDAIRKNIGDSIVTLDKDYLDRKPCQDPLGIKGTMKECSSVSEIVVNPAVGEEKAGELLGQAGEDLKGIAWLRNVKKFPDEELFKGSTVLEIVENLKPYLREYKDELQKNNGKPLRIDGIFGFTDEDGYTNEKATYVDTDYKFEWFFKAQKDKYTPMEITSSGSTGIIVNHSSRIITLTMYDFSGLAIDNKIASTGKAGSVMGVAGYAFTDKKSQINHKIDFRGSAISYNGVLSQLLSSLSPIPKGTYFESTLIPK